VSQASKDLIGTHLKLSLAAFERATQDTTMLAATRQWRKRRGRAAHRGRTYFPRKPLSALARQCFNHGSGRARIIYCSLRLLMRPQDQSGAVGQRLLPSISDFK